MNRKDDFNDEKIEELMRSMPDIKDSRSKEEILLNLKADERLKSRSEKNYMKNKRSKWIPILVAISAIFLFSLLLPSLLQSNKTEDAAESTNVLRTADEDKADIENELESKPESNTSNSEESESDQSSLVSIPEYDDYAPAVYPQNIIDHTVFHIGFASDAAASVPLTFVIPNDQIDQDFGELAPKSFDLYEMYAGKLDEESLGFMEYHPYKGKLDVEGDTVIHTLPKGHNYDIASAAIATYMGTLQDTFYGYKEIAFENEDGTPVEFDQVGEASEPIPLMSGKEKVNFYLFKQGDGKEFLSSNFGKSYETLEAALNEMKIKPNDIYSPVIPEDISFSLNDENDLMTITFSEPLNLNEMEPKQAQQMIDGILLTAASFDTQIKFENVVQSEWQSFTLSEVSPMPIGANFMRFMLK